MKKQFYLVLLFISLLELSFAKNNFDFSTVVSGSTNKNVLSGYFNPDNFRDIVEYLPATGKIRVGISNGKPDFLNGASSLSYKYTVWATVQPASGWVFQTGDFTGDGRTDLLGYNPTFNGSATSGSIWLGVNTGSSFVFSNWAILNSAKYWSFYQGDFNKDGKQDIAGYQTVTSTGPNKGDVWVGLNTGTGFTLSKLMSLSTSATRKIYPGDFNNDSYTDLAVFDSATGSLDLLNNTTTGSFNNINWGAVPASAAGWQFYPGLYNNDASLDIMGYDAATGNLTLCKNVNNLGFSNENWFTVSPASGWVFTPGDFSGDGKTDILGYESANAGLWLGFNNNNAFQFNQWDYTAALSSSSGWTFQTGDFNNDNRIDILCVNSLLNLRKMGINAPRPEGYCWPLSGKPGQKIYFSISGNGSHSLQFQRYTSLDTMVNAFSMLTIPNVNYKAQFISPMAWKEGCGWDTTYTLTIPAGWQSGYYALQLTDLYGKSDYISFIVKPSVPSATKIALIANVNTWQAYNPWDGSILDGTGDHDNGHGKYNTTAKYATFNFLRPNPSAKPVIDETNEHSQKRTQEHLVRGELWVYTWLVNNGYSPDVYTDIDLHNGNISTAYKYLFLHTHPEYWTKEMYDNTANFLKTGSGTYGGNLINIGGNSIYESCKYSFSSSSKKILFYNGVDGSDRDSFLFRNPRNIMFAGTPRFEKNLLGIQTVLCDAVGSPFTKDPTYAGTDFYNIIYEGVTANTFGEKSYCTGDHGAYGGASGWEIDGIGNGSCGVFMPIVPLVANLKILASSPEGASITYIPSYATIPMHGFVFSAGSLTFGGSLVQDTVIQRIMRNVLGPWNVLLKQPQNADIPDYTSSAIKISPNPVHQSINISCGLDKINKITLMTVDGKKILEKRFDTKVESNIRIDRPANTSPGLYILNISSNGGKRSVVQKIVLE